MTDDPTTRIAPSRDDLTAGVELEWEPLPGGKLRLAAYHQGEPVHSAEHPAKILGNPTLKGQFTNNVVGALDDQNGVDAAVVETELRQWFAEMNELDKEEQADKLLTDDVQAIIDGTGYPVEVRGGETSTWHVTLTYAGRTRELEFTASEMVSGGGAALQEKIANDFFELVEIEPEDWEAIRDRWQEHKEVVGYVEETGEDTVAERVLEYLGHNVTPVGEREKMANGPEAAWFDETNSTGSDAAPPEAPIVWVQDSFLVDQLEAAGKQLEYKGQLVKSLAARGDLYGVESDGRKSWPNSRGKESKAKFYPFRPESLGVNADDVGDVDDPAHGEVSP